MTLPRFLLLAVAGAIGDGSVMGRASGVFAQGRGHHTAPITIPARWWLWIILFVAGVLLTHHDPAALNVPLTKCWRSVRCSMKELRVA